MENHNLYLSIDFPLNIYQIYRVLIRIIRIETEHLPPPNPKTHPHTATV